MSKGAQTRSVILKTALAVTSREGLDSLSIGNLAKEVGLSKSGLFAHFDSKEDLLLQVMETAIDRFIEDVIAPALRKPRGVPRVRALFENWFEWSECDSMPGGCPLINGSIELDDRPGPLRDRLVQAQRDWIESLATAARIAVDEGHFRSDLDTEQFAYDLHSIILGHHFFHRLLRDPKTHQRRKQAFEALLERCYEVDRQTA